MVKQTTKHFGAIYGVHIPESTVRGLRSQYIKTMSNTNETLHNERNAGIANTDGMSSTGTVSNQDANTADATDLLELNYGKRGRPMRLGKVKIDKVSTCRKFYIANGTLLILNIVTIVEFYIT